MSEARFDTAAVVLGMHRSGTSALAGALGLVGFAAPRTLLPASAVNERGFWESQPLKALNDEVFAELGTNWYGLQPISSAVLNEERFAALRARAEQILLEEFEPGARPVIKDPRLCRLLPLWRPAFDRLAQRTVYAITLRSPVEVAESLAQRNDFDPALGLVLWTRYYLDAEHQTRGAARAFVSYPNLVEHPQDALGSAQQTLGLPVDLSRVDTAQLGEFLSAELRHHRGSDEASAGLDRVPGLEATWRILMAWASGREECEDDREQLDRARGELDGVGSFLSGILETGRLEHKRLVAARTQSDATRTELDRVRRSLEDLRELRAAIQQQAAAAEQLAARQQEQLGEIDKRLRKAASREQSANERLEKTLDSLQSEVRGRAALDRALAATVQHSEALKARLGELQHELDRTEAKVRQGAADFERERAEFRAVRDELKTVKRKYRATQDNLARERERLADARAKLAESELALARYLNSLAWRTYDRGARMLHRIKPVVGHSKARQRKQQLALLKASELFDRGWYLQSYPDVAGSGVDPARHYLEFGWREGRDPGPSFSTTAYLKANADVAAHGANPLLHYVEYGHFEGRGAPEHAAPAVPAARLEEFASAADCSSFAVADCPAVRWSPSAQLDGSASSMAAIGGSGVGAFADPGQRRAFEAALARFSSLSEPASPSPVDGADVRVVRIIDAWHVGGGLLRTRWRLTDGERPFVVRVIGRSADGETRLMGETLVEQELDVVDVRPANPLFPLLFVFCEPGGEVLGWRTMAFPSLCRGGLHYPEFVALAQDSSAESGAADLCELGETLAERLFELRGGGTALLSAISVGLSGADGTHPLFQSEFQSWLASVAGVPVQPHGDDPAAGASAFLAEAVRLETNGERGDAEGILLLDPDMIPSISILVANAGESTGEAPAPGAGLVAVAADPSQPSTLIHGMLPDPPVLITRDGSRLKPMVKIAALRMPQSRPLSDAELLVPVAAPELAVRPNPAGVTWLVWPGASSESDLLQSLESLGTQTDAGLFEIAFVGTPPTAAEAVARRLFDGRVRAFAQAGDALDTIGTPLTGYLGPGVILHDSRTAAVLAGMLDEPGAETAAPVLVSADKRGKGWVVSPADAGTIPAASEPLRAGAAAAADSLLMWRKTWLTAQPPRDLWLSRTAAAKAWLDGTSAGGRHVCTASVTASYGAPRSDDEAPLTPPPAPAGFLTTELVVG